MRKLPPSLRYGATCALLALLLGTAAHAQGTFTGSLTTLQGSAINITGTQALSGNGSFISGVYGPVQVPASSSSASALSAFFTTSGDRGQTAYTGLFNQTNTSAGQGGTWYGGLSLAQVSGTWTTAASGISGPIGFQMGAVSNRGGFAFGANPYCTTQTVAATACVGMEVDTNNTINGTVDKVGIQVVDIATSTGTTSGLSSAYLVGAVTGANLFSNGFNVAVGNGVFPLKATGTAFSASGGTVSRGLDLNGLTCSNECIRSPGFAVNAVGNINTGAAGVSTGGINFVGITSGFAVLSTTATGGHLTYAGSGTAPTNNACTGFSLGTGSTDIAGKVTFTSATSCAINFGAAFANAPFCTAAPGSAASTVQVSATTSVLTVTFGTANTSMSWQCYGA